MASGCDETNAYQGDVLTYQPIQGAGAAVVGLTPTRQPAPDLEFDEDNLDIYSGERNVLSDKSIQDPTLGDEL